MSYQVAAQRALRTAFSDYIVRLNLMGGFQSPEEMARVALEAITPLLADHAERYPQSQHLGEQVRIWDGPKQYVRAQGKLIAVIPEPVLVVEDAEGKRYHESPSLAMDVQHTEWRRA